MGSAPAHPAAKDAVTLGVLCAFAGFFQWVLTLCALGETVHSLGHSGHDLSTLAILFGDQSDTPDWLLLFLLCSLLPCPLARIRSGEHATAPPLPLWGCLANLILASLTVWVLALDGAWLPDRGPHARVMWTLAGALLLGGTIGLFPRIRDTMWIAAIVPAGAFLANVLAPRPSHPFDLMTTLFWRLGPLAFLPLASLGFSLYTRIRRSGTLAVPAANGLLVLSLWGLAASTTMGALMPHHHLCVHLGTYPEREIAKYLLIAATQLALFMNLFWGVRHRWRKPSAAEVWSSRSD